MSRKSRNVSWAGRILGKRSGAIRRQYSVRLQRRKKRGAS